MNFVAPAGHRFAAIGAIPIVFHTESGALLLQLGSKIDAHVRLRDDHHDHSSWHCHDWRYVALVVVLWRPALSASSSASASVTALRWEPCS